MADNNFSDRRWRKTALASIVACRRSRSPSRHARHRSRPGSIAREVRAGRLRRRLCHPRRRNDRHPADLPGQCRRPEDARQRVRSRPSWWCSFAAAAKRLRRCRRACGRPGLSLWPTSRPICWSCRRQSLSRSRPLPKHSFKPIRCGLLGQGAVMRRREFSRCFGRRGFAHAVRSARSAGGDAGGWFPSQHIASAIRKPR